MKQIFVIVCILFLVKVASSQEVKINTNFAIETDGTLRVDGNATTWDDLRVTLDKGADAARLKDVGIGGIQIWHFEENRDDAMSFTVQLPHTWKEGSRIYPHIHWMPKSAASGNVEWQFEYSWANYNSSTPEAFPSVSTLTSIGSTGSTSLAHRITSFDDTGGGIDGTGKKISSILICRIRRDAGNVNDTYAGDVGALYFDIHIEINTMGSRSEFSK